MSGNKLRELRRECSGISHDMYNGIADIQKNHQRSIADLERDKYRYRLDHDIAGMGECDALIDKANSELQPSIDAIKEAGKQLVDSATSKYQEELARVEAYDIMRETRE